MRKARPPRRAGQVGRTGGPDLSRIGRPPADSPCLSWNHPKTPIILPGPHDRSRRHNRARTPPGPTGVAMKSRFLASLAGLLLAAGAAVAQPEPLPQDKPTPEKPTVQKPADKPDKAPATAALAGAPIGAE